jgi:hypothetical protein
VTYEQAREVLREAAAGGNVGAARVLEASDVATLRHYEQDLEWEIQERARRQRRVTELRRECARLRRRIGRRGRS